MVPNEHTVWLNLVECASVNKKMRVYFKFDNKEIVAVCKEHMEGKKR